MSLLKLITISVLLFSFVSADAQFREIYNGNDRENDVTGISFLSPSTGYVSFDDHIGFTQDSGHTFIKSYITNNNVDFNNYSANTLLGFSINGVHAFSIDSIITYGAYFGEPSILISFNRGQNWKLVFNKDLNPNNPNIYNRISDIVFPGNGNIGYAVHEGEILKTTNRGQTWTNSANISNIYRFSFPSANTGYAVGIGKLYKTYGSTWQTLSLPQGALSSDFFDNVSFLSNNIGYITNASKSCIYKTTDGGTTWQNKNDENITPMWGNRMHFINDSTGFISQYNIYKTVDNGATWEPCKRNIEREYPNYPLRHLFFYDKQTAWAGGKGEYVMLSTNSGGSTLPKAYFKIDTAGYHIARQVNLENYSRKNYSYEWYKNGVLLSNNYNASYISNICHSADTIVLIVSDGIYKDTSVQYKFYNIPQTTITSFSPTSGLKGNTLTINGSNFNNATSVSIGGVLVNSFTIISSSTITTIIGDVNSGDILVNGQCNSASLAGFKYIPPVPKPLISSINSLQAGQGNSIIIKGINFNNVSEVKFGNIAAASFEVISNNTIVAKLSGGESGIISVITSAGTATFNGFTFIQQPSVTAFSPQSGNTGTVLTITGNDFLTASEVTIGNLQAASFQVISNTTITATVGTGFSGKVAVVTKGGKSEYGNFSFTGSAINSLPQINSFVPLSAIEGNTVTISGSNFSNILSNNIVYFGPVKAQVVSATSSTLQVLVPAGAAYGRISVTANALTAFSILSFIPTFQNGEELSDSSFFNNEDIYTYPYFISGLSLADVNSDGKADIVSGREGVNGSYLFSQIYTTENLSSKNNFIYRTPILVKNDTAEASYDVVSGDLDGDGKLDVAGAYIKSGKKIMVFRNKSYNNQIQFSEFLLDQSLDNTFSHFTPNILIEDLDNDGKPEVCATRQPNIVSIFKNKSTIGNFLFDPKIDIPVIGIKNPNYQSFSMNFADLNNDHKPELILAHYDSASLLIFKNISTTGVIAFEPPVKLSTLPYPIAILIADLNIDGKNDLILSTGNSNSISVFNNISNSGGLAFLPKKDFHFEELRYTGGSNGMALGDLNGDSMPDLAVLMGLEDNNKLAILQNNSLADSISFDFKASYPIPPFSRKVVIGDIDYDKKPDLIINLYKDLSKQQGTPYILRNKMNEQNVISLCPSTNGTLLEANFYNRYLGEWQINKGAGFIPVLPDSNHQYLNSTTGYKLQLNNIKTDWSGYQYRYFMVANEDSVYSYVYTIKFTNTWTGAVSNLWENSGNWSCGYVPDKNTDVRIDGGNIIMTSNTTIKSLTVNPGVNISFQSEAKLTILK